MMILGRSPALASAVIRRVASMPSMTGMRTSMSTTSGCWSWQTAIASAPSAASPMTDWWAIAVLMVTFAAAVDTRQGLVVGIGTAVFVAGVLTTTGWVVVRAVGSAQPRNDLLGPAGVVAILGFVAVTVGVSLAVAFILKASGVAYAATIGVSVAAVLLVVGGPMLMRHLQRRMLANRSGSRR